MLTDVLKSYTFFLQADMFLFPFEAQCSYEIVLIKEKRVKRVPINHINAVPSIIVCSMPHEISHFIKMAEDWSDYIKSFWTVTDDHFKPLRSTSGGGDGSHLSIRS